MNIAKEYSKDISLTFSVPQGSCAGPVLYLVYASTLQEVIPGNFQLHRYADDHIFKCAFNASGQRAEIETVTSIESCAQDIKTWMDNNRLRINSSKTEFILFGNSVQVAKCQTKELNINQEKVQLTDTIKYLGVWLDKQFNLKHHIVTKCRTGMYNIHRIKQIRPMLTKDATHTLVLGLVISHLDYSNGIMFGLPETSLRKLQVVQNIAAKLVLEMNKYSSATEARRLLHWLPIKACIEFKILSLVYKCLEGTVPEYLRNLLVLKKHPRAGLRSSHFVKQLVGPFTRRKTFAPRSFSVCGPLLWNSIPDKLKTCRILIISKKELKTYLFKKYYN